MMSLGTQLCELRGFVRPYRTWLVVAFIATAGGALLSLAFPWVMGYLVDSAFAQDDTAPLDRSSLLLLAVSAG